MPTPSGRFFLAAVLDLYARSLVDWAVSAVNDRPAPFVFVDPFVLFVFLFVFVVRLVALILESELDANVVILEFDAWNVDRDHDAAHFASSVAASVSTIAAPQALCFAMHIGGAMCTEPELVELTGRGERLRACHAARGLGSQTIAPAANRRTGALSVALRSWSRTVTLPPKWRRTSATIVRATSPTGWIEPVNVEA